MDRKDIPVINEPKGHENHTYEHEDSSSPFRRSQNNSALSFASNYDSLVSDRIRNELQEPSSRMMGRRRSSHFSFSGINESPDTDRYDRRRSMAITSQELIIASSQHILPLKDFSSEVKCKRDIELFVSDARILLDCEHNHLEDIIQSALKLLLNDKPNKCVDEAKSILFAHESASLMSNTHQGIFISDDGQYMYDQSWICTYCSLPLIFKRRIGIVRLIRPTNFGVTSHDVQFLVIVLAPVKEKMTKSAEEVSRTFASLFADYSVRTALSTVDSESRFIDILSNRAQILSQMSQMQFLKKLQEQDSDNWRITFGRGVISDVKRRYKYYISDFVDGFKGHKALYKTTATIAFLYFACILPCIAFGVLDSKNTNGLIDMRRALIGQTIGGLFFALFSGQPMVIIMTTAPLCLYTKVVYDIAEDLNVDFYAMFACVGLWNSLFVIIYALFDVSYVMKWCTRSTEEIFALFIFFAFSVDAIKECVRNFQDYYCIDSAINSTMNSTISITSESKCSQQESVLFLFLMLATVWLAMVLYNLNYTPYLSQRLREFFADYALPISVIAFSFVGSYLFRDIEVEGFEIKDESEFEFKAVRFNRFSVGAVFISAGLGFALSLLFFMDQNISAALANNPNNNLKKGDAYHWDLLIVGVLNAFLSIFGLPWMHGILPHSPLHARSLSDIEQHTVEGHVKEVVVHIRETRVTGIFTHVLIGLSLLLIPYLDYIPVSVLSGLFLYCAFATLRGNSFFDRILLFITEQSSYPPNHYVRRCPQRKIHIFTCAQLIQLLVLCFFGFIPIAYVQMAFPIIIAIFIPIRWKIVPRIISEEYLKVVDGYH